MSDVWVISDASGKWERYTEAPFSTVKAAEAWIKRYVLDARTDVRERIY